MARRGPIQKRQIKPDPLYNSLLVSQLRNKVMLDGKKTKADEIVYKAMDILKEKADPDPLTVLKKAVDNIKPRVEVRSRRVGGASYQIPVDVRPERANSLAIRWIVGYARQRGEKSMQERLAGELLDAYRGTGASIKKRDDLYRMAEGNKAFAHYRW